MEALRTDHRVNLAYSDAGSQRYVSVSGHCELVRDHVKAKQLWNPVYKTWFPKGLDDPNLILLKVHVQEAEYWDARARPHGAASRFARGRPFSASRVHESQEF